jgi:hypothetical protein
LPLLEAAAPAALLCAAALLLLPWLAEAPWLLLAELPWLLLAELPWLAEFPWLLLAAFPFPGFAQEAAEPPITRAIVIAMPITTLNVNLSDISSSFPRPSKAVGYRPLATETARR